MKAKTIPEQRALGRTNAQIRMLAAQFVLGMSENLIGKPSETQGLSKATSVAALSLHVLIGVGLIISGALAVRLAAGEARARQLAIWGEVGVLVAFAAGMLNMADVAGGSWWSFIMAIAFLEALLVYGALYIRLQKNAA